MKSLWIATLLAAVTARGQTTSSVPDRVTVPAEKSYTGKAFEYTRFLREQTHKLAVYDVRYPSPVVSPHEANNTVPAELYLPVGVTRDRAFPAVVCLHIIHDNFDLERLLCTRMAQGGVIALFFKQPYYGERGGSVGKAMLATGSNIFMGGLEQGLEDARRAVDILAAMSEVDAQHIGITGISIGAIQSASVCGREPRIRKAFLTLGGCDIKKIILSAHETRRMKAFIQGLPQEEQERIWACIDRLDPIQAKEALRKLGEGGNLRMVCAEQDEVVPPECGRRLAEAAGIADRVTWLPGMGHYTAMAGFPQIMKDIVAFFGADVPAAWHPPQGNGDKTPVELLGAFMSGFAAFLGGQPAAGTAHMVGGDAEVTVDGKAYRAAFDYVAGGDGMFRLAGDFPVVGKAGFGQCDYPWMIGGGKTAFCGTAERQDGRTATPLIAPQRLMRYRVAAGALAGVALSPEALQQYYTLADSHGTNGERRVEVKVDYKNVKGTLNLTFAKDATPLVAEWAFGHASGKARLTHWRLNAVADESVFDPPRGLPRKEVRQEDLLRMFAAVFEFAMEATE
jgi:dienelactone hydrolase